VVDDADVATTDGVGRRQRWAARQTGAATRGGGGRAGVANKGGRDNRGWQRATGIGREGGRWRWLVGRAAANGGGGGGATGDGRAGAVGADAGGRARRLLLGTERRKRNEHRGYWLIRITPVGQSTRPTGVKLFPSALMTGRQEFFNRHRLGL
jgi:hypothetical protein